MCRSGAIPDEVCDIIIKQGKELKSKEATVLRDKGLAQDLRCERGMFQMNCWHCNNELIWGGDFDYEDYGLEGEGIVSNLSCPNCNAYVEVYLKIDEEDGDGDK